MSRLFLRIFLLPFWLLGRLGRLVYVVFKPVFDHVDASPRLSELIKWLSSSMATQRGLLLVVGTGLLILSGIMHLLVVVGLVISDTINSNLYWLCIPFALFHLGTLAGFTGIMLAVPLGQGYKDNQ